MKYRIWDPECIREAEPEVVLRLHLGYDSAQVVAVDPLTGEVIRTLITFNFLGRIYRNVGIDPSLGFDLDDKQRIKLDCEE